MTALSPREQQRARSMFAYVPPEPPGPDEFELTLLGPSFGESSVLHLGQGTWMIVDSCRHRRLNAAEGYLYHLGVDPSTAVKRIVVSHWHKDHVSGLGRLLESCPGALLVVPAALNVSDVYRMAYEQAASLKHENRFDKGRPTVVEYAEAMKIVSTRHGEGHEAIIFANHTSEILEEPDMHVLVRAWSPSGRVQQECHERVGELCAALATDDPDVPRQIDPNSLSVVLSVRAGDRCILLGADLEREASRAKGWQAVAEVAGRRLLGAAEVLKVPHHGSITSEDPALWTLCKASTCGVLAPCRVGRVLLPGKEDISRVMDHVAELYCTASPIDPDSSDEEIDVTELGAVTLRSPKYGPATWTSFNAPRAVHHVRSTRGKEKMESVE